MRVLHVIPSIAPGRGGPSEVVRRMVAAQLAHGIEAEIATSDEGQCGPVQAGKRIVLEELPVRFFPRAFTHGRVLAEYAFCPSFAPWLRTNIRSYDILHVHALFSHLSTTAMRVGRAEGVPYLSRPLGQLGRWPLRQSAWRKAAYLRLVENRNLRGAAALHFASTAEQTEAADLGFTTRGVVVPHGVHLPPPVEDAAAKLRLRFGIGRTRGIVLFLGRLHRKKGLDLLLRAMALLPVPRPVLLIAGDGPEHDALRRLAHELGLAGELRWLGAVDGGWKKICLQGADLFALTSHHENFGVAVLEALAVGTRVLVSPQVALASMVTHHRLGLVAPLEPGAMAAALRQGLVPSTAAERADRREFVARHFSWTANATALAGLYHDATKDRASRGQNGALKQPPAMKSVVTYAPGRAELLGNHTDYNEGYVLAIAVDRGTTFTGQPREDRLISLRSRELDSTVEIELDQLAAEKVPDWSRYTLGVVDVFRRQGVALGGFSGEITSTLPMGAGLSSSASLENATVLFLLQAFGGSLPPLQIAKFAQMAEHDFVGVRCGLLDQISSLMSRAHHATFIDCRTFDVRHLPLSDHVSFVLAQSGVKHALVAGEYNERRSDCEAAARALGVKALRDVTVEMLEACRSTLPDRIFKRARHIVGENERVLAGSQALEQGDLKAFGQLMYESHESSRVYFENSVPELDDLVQAARKVPGVYGARLSGGGFGGATINLVERGQEDALVQALQAAVPGSACLVTAASDGALDRVKS